MEIVPNKRHLFHSIDRPAFLRELPVRMEYLEINLLSSTKLEMPPNVVGTWFRDKNPYERFVELKFD
jgi:hypothetical protein